VQPEITAVRPSINGVFVTLRCAGCGGAFESMQHEVAGIHVGTHACPSCGARQDVRPADFAAAIERHLPDVSWDTMGAITEDASAIATRWYASPSIAGAVVHEGVDVGSCVELYVQPHITSGILLDLRRRSA
jgi:hypothetical protein